MSVTSATNSSLWSNGQPLADGDGPELSRFLEVSDRVLASDTPEQARRVVDQFEPLLRKYQDVDLTSISDPQERAQVEASRARFAQLRALADQSSGTVPPPRQVTEAAGTQGLSPPQCTVDVPAASNTLKVLKGEKQDGSTLHVDEVDDFITTTLQSDGQGTTPPRAAAKAGGNEAASGPDASGGRLAKDPILLCMLVLLECMIELGKISSAISNAQAEALVKQLKDVAENIKDAGKKAFAHAFAAAIVQIAVGLVQAGCAARAAKLRLEAANPELNDVAKAQLIYSAERWSAVASSLDSIFSHGAGGAIKAWGDNEVAKIQGAGEELKAIAETIRNAMEKSGTMSRSAAEALANILSAISQMLQSNTQTQHSLMTLA